MLSSIAAGSSAPVGPPARPSGNQPASLPISSGMPETSPMMTSAFSPRTGSSRFPLRNSTEPLRPSVSAFCRATSIACSDRSVPITRRAPRRAATKDRTPLPHPTSITVSSGPISRESAIARLVWVGWKTPSPSDTVNGPVRPFHSSVVGLGSSLIPHMVAGRGRGSQPSGRSHAWTIEDGALAGPNAAVLDRVRQRLGLPRDARGSDPQVPVGVAAQASRCTPEQPNRAVRVAPQQVDVSGPQLRQALEELGVVGVAGLLPRGLPRLVGREVAAGVQVLAAEPVDLLDRQGVEVLQLEDVLGLPRLGTPERVARPRRLVARLRRPAGLADRVFGHHLIVAADQHGHACWLPAATADTLPAWTRPPRRSHRRAPRGRNPQRTDHPPVSQWPRTAEPRSADRRTGRVPRPPSRAACP